jgi:hypothetical protein
MNSVDLTLIILLVHALSTSMMTGLIWFVQIVHYPLMSRVGSDDFVSYERAHTRATTWVVGPLMIAELISAIYLLAQADSDAVLMPIVGLVALGGIWGSTLLLQIPAHRILEQRFDAKIHARLVQTNWIRTFLWSLRSLLAMWMLASIL